MIWFPSGKLADAEVPEFTKGEINPADLLIVAPGVSDYKTAFRIQNRSSMNDNSLAKDETTRSWLGGRSEVEAAQIEHLVSGLAMR